MHAARLVHGASASEVEQAAQTLSVLATRSSHLSELIRSLVREPSSSPIPLRAQDLLDDLLRDLDEPCAARVCVDAPPDLPLVLAEPDVLQAILSCAVYDALEESAGGVQVSAQASGEGLRFTVRAEGPSADPGSALRGRELLVRAADWALRGRGGRVDSRHSDGANRFTVHLD